MLTTHDLTKVLTAVNLLNSDHKPETLPRRTFDSVRLLIPTDVISYEGFGTDTYYQGPLWFEPTENVSNQMLSAMSEYVSDHPIFLGGDIHELSRAVRVSDFVTLPTFRKTVIYNEFFRHLGTNRQLSAALHVTAQLSISCSLCRFGNDFTARECKKLDLLTPHLTSAFRNAQFTNRLFQQSEDLIEMLASGNIGIISLDSSLVPHVESVSARKLLAKYFHQQDALPSEIMDFVKYHLSIFLEDEFYLPPAPLVNVSDGEKLVIRIQFQSATRTTVLFLEEIAKPFHLNDSGFGLTTREFEVLSLVSIGKTDPEISLLLNISVRTVHKHIENIFKKLHVETRTAAASLMF